MKKADFDNTLNNFSRLLQVKKKLNNLAKKVKLISAKGLKKDLINNYSMFNGAKIW